MGTTKKDKQKVKKNDTPNTSSPNVPTPYILFDVMVYPTNQCPSLEGLKALLHALKASSPSPSPLGEKPTVSRNKGLCTNKPYIIYAWHGHYTHHFLDFP